MNNTSYELSKTQGSKFREDEHQDQEGKKSHMDCRLNNKKQLIKTVCDHLVEIVYFSKFTIEHFKLKFQHTQTNSTAYTLEHRINRLDESLLITIILSIRCQLTILCIHQIELLRWLQMIIELLLARCLYMLWSNLSTDLLA